MEGEDLELNYKKEYKELEIILSDFKCDKHCPYCTAKITKWAPVEDDLYQLEMYVGQLKELGYTFHYVTIGGNGEPTLHSYKKLKEIVEMFKDYEIPVKRVLTSGNVFRESEKEKWKLFVDNGWMFECTTTSFDNYLDRKVLGYDRNYFETERFRNSKIRLNYVLLKNNIDNFVDEIKNFIATYPNIGTVALKLLNVNTKTGLADNPLSKWIVEHAVAKEEREHIAGILNQNFPYKGEAFDTHSWEFDKEHEIYFSWKRLPYGYMDLVYYGNRFVDYQLNDSDIQLIPKVYLAAKFEKQKNIDGSLSLKNDFRSKMIGEENFFNFNSHSFLRDNDGNALYQYIGPFYNEKASDGELTSTICEEVVKTESLIIDHCDIFIAYLDEEVSPGGISELIYAAFKGKEIWIFYKVENNTDYELKTSNWYPCISAMQIRGKEHIKMIPVKDKNEVTSYLNGNKKEKNVL